MSGGPAIDTLNAFTQRWSATYRLVVWRTKTARALWSGSNTTEETAKGNDGDVLGYRSMLHWMHRTTAGSTCTECIKLHNLEKMIWVIALFADLVAGWWLCSYLQASTIDNNTTTNHLDDGDDFFLR